MMTDPGGNKYILLVDDEASVATALARGLRMLGENYIINTANNAPIALEKLAETSYDLVITDYKMPQVSGLELAQTIKEQYPQTKIILMSGYGTKNLRQQAKQAFFSGYIEKPFTLSQFRNLVKQIALSKEKKHKKKTTSSLWADKQIQESLQQLHRKTNAHCVLLLSSNGYPIEVVGQTYGLDIYSLGALIAANCSIFKTNYHEGESYNVYAYDVNCEVFLAIVFSKQIKPGIIWFYTKQTTEQLLSTVPASP